MLFLCLERKLYAFDWKDNNMGGIMGEVSDEPRDAHHGGVRYPP